MARKTYPRWTAIAAQLRDSSNVWEKITWMEYPDAQMSLVEARLLAKTSLIPSFL